MKSRAELEAATRLAVYGTLAPGEINHHVLSPMRGHWLKGSVRGRLLQRGWGAGHGFPGLVLDPEASPVAVQVFCSEELVDHWARLDDFEGAEYERVLVAVEIPDGEPLVSYIYAVRDHLP